MNICLETPVPADTTQCQATDHIDSLARTCDLTDDPIRIEDVSGACLYENGPAAKQGIARHRLVTFDIVDHTNRVVARLHTCPC